MIFGVISDTHDDKMNAIPSIVKEFEKHHVEIIIHCGDIESQHLNAKLFGNLPVVCALLDEQSQKGEFCFSPNNWRFTTPDNRIVTLPSELRFYVGHKRSFEFLLGSGDKLSETLNRIRKENDGVEILFSGHTHRQAFKGNRLINFINPGAVENSFDGYEFAIVNTKTKEVTFSRIPKTKSEKEPFSVAIISDSFDISTVNPNFWKEFSEILKKHNVSHVIHCGNIIPRDIGRLELKTFQVWYNLHENREKTKIPDNWHPLNPKRPIVTIKGYKFYIQLNLGTELSHKSEFDLHDLCMKLSNRHSGISYLLCGSTNSPSLEEGEETRIIDPGDVRNDQDFVIVTLPRNEILFSHVPFKELK